MPKKPTKSPQQKKALSLKRDRRSVYGNNDKAARKAIPLRKALENRKVRHKTNRELSAAEQLDPEKLDLVESSARHDVGRVGGWRKGADAPLGEVIARDLKARVERVGSKIARRRPAQ